MKNHAIMYIIGIIIAGVFFNLPSILATPAADASAPAALPTRTLPGANAGTVVDNESENSDSKTGALVGYVWDEFSQKHAANVVVKANGLETMTDEDGFFAFNNVPVGSYEVTVEIPEGGAPQYSWAKVELEDEAIWNLDLSFASQPLAEPVTDDAESTTMYMNMVADETEVMPAVAMSGADGFNPEPIMADITLTSESKPAIIQSASPQLAEPGVLLTQMNYDVSTVGIDAPQAVPVTLEPRKASAPTNSSLDACANSPITVYKGDDPEMVVTPGLVNHEIGQEGCIKIDVGDMVDMGAFQGELHFDPDLIEIKSVALGDFLGQANRQVTLVSELNEQDGLIYLGTFSSGKAAAPNGGGTLVIIKFTTKAEGQTAVDLKNVLSTDHMGNDNVQENLNITNGIIRSTACFGDLNTDKQINVNDIQSIAGRIDQPTLYDEAYDFNADGVINNVDIDIVMERWNQICG